MKPGETPEEIADLHGHWSTAMRKELAEHIQSYGDRRGEEERAAAEKDRDSWLIAYQQRFREMESALATERQKREEERAKALSFESVAAWANQNERAVVGLEYLHTLTKRAVDAETRAALAEKTRAEERAKTLGDAAEIADTAEADQSFDDLSGAAQCATIARRIRSLAAAPSGDAPVEAIRDTTGEPEPSLRSLASDAIAQAYAKGRAEMAERAAQIAEFDGAKGTANTVRSIIEAPSGDAKGTK